MPKNVSCTEHAGAADGVERGHRLHQRLAGAAGLRDRDEARRLQRQHVEQEAECVGIEIVHEMQARKAAQRADAGHVVAGELDQRLAAEARSAGAEDNDVGGVLRQPLGGVGDGCEVVLARRQPQQGKAAILVALAQLLERSFAALQHVGITPLPRRPARLRVRSRANSIDWVTGMAGSTRKTRCLIAFQATWVPVRVKKTRPGITLNFRR